MLTSAEEKEIELRLLTLNDIELIELQLDLMDIILEKKMDEGKIVFSEVENGLLN